MVIMAQVAQSRPRVVMGLLFFPRGGSAQVTRSLARSLIGQGWDVTVVSGSLQLPGYSSDAQTFFRGLNTHAVDYTAALQTDDPLRGDPPLHPSYEDRCNAPDRIFAMVDDSTYKHLVSSWGRILYDVSADQADILHLHHLTPLNAAAAHIAPTVPVVGHLHGTELLMLEAIAQGPPKSWVHAQPWADRMRCWAQSCQRIIVSTYAQVARAQALLEIDPSRCYTLPNGFDPHHFDRRSINRIALWHQLLVDYPRGWAPSSGPGSVRYQPHMLAPFAQGPVLLYVGRFTLVKRLSLLITAYNSAQAAFSMPAPLVLLGGFPGEWEGEHPLETIQRTGARNVFLAEWHDHDKLPDIMAASDVIVLPSVREQFGQVLVEGMACGLPVIATNTHGPSEIVENGQTGWLVPPDNEQALSTALVEAVNNASERRRRGRAAYLAVREHYGWPILGAKLARAYETLLKGYTKEP
jgi:glycosyltransferase involved in cell wall biosynthesis